MLLATILGTIAGYMRGILDGVLSRFFELLWAYPALLLGIALLLDCRDLCQDQLEAIDLAQDLCLEPRWQNAPVAGPQTFELRAPVAQLWIKVAYPLRRQQALDPVAMLDARTLQYLALAADAAPVLLVRRRRHDHRAHARLAPLERQQRAQQRQAVDLVGLGIATPARHRDRGRVDHVALDPLVHQHAVNPESIVTRLLDRDDRVELLLPRQRFRLELAEQGPKLVRRPGLDLVLRYLLPAGLDRTHHPFYRRQFQ